MDSRKEKVEELRQDAEHYRSLYNLGACTREEAKQHIQPYLDLVNEKSKELAKKYGRRPMKIEFPTYVR